MDKMQTFLPEKSFHKSAQVLDRLRLGKQRVETLQILKALHDPSYGWQNHPAVNMWRGHENALVLYGLAMCNEWKSRGYKDTCTEKIRAFFKSEKDATPPDILCEELYASHRSNLLRKDYGYYSKFGWTEPLDIPYYWKNEITK